MVVPRILKIIVPNSGGSFAVTGLGKAHPIVDPANALYSLHFIGNLYNSAPLVDLSGNARTLTQVGVGIGDYFLSGAATSYLDLPYTGAALVAATGSGTMVALSKVPAAQNAVLITNYPKLAASQDISLTAMSSSAARTFSNSTLSIDATIASDAGRGAAFEATAGVFGPTFTTAYRKKAGGVLQSASTSFASTQTIGGSRNMRIGYGYDATFPGTSSIAVIANYAAAMTSTQVEAVLDELLAFAVSVGI